MRTRRQHRAGMLVASLAMVLGVSACGKTTIDSSVTEAPDVEVTTTLPTGTPDELLPRLVAEAGKLSEAIGAQEGDSRQLAVVADLFDAVRPEIAATDGVAALSFDGAFELCQKGERFNRPADADKCFRNLRALSDAYLAAN